MTSILISFKFILSYIMMGLIGITGLICFTLHYFLIKRKALKHPYVTYTCVKENYSLIKSNNNIIRPGNFLSNIINFQLFYL